MYKTSEIEDLFLEAEKAFDEGNHREGKRLLTEILAEEPSFGRAHNHLGWLYKTKYQDYKMAERHFKLAINFNPEYPSTYLNYAFLLRDLYRLNEMEELLNKALKVDTINKCGIYDEFGSMYELRGEYNKAIKNYRTAIKYCLNDGILDDLKKHIKRCKKKKSIFSRFRRFVERLEV
jgi:tetratricopeptide (TPR) repeat protein